MLFRSTSAEKKLMNSVDYANQYANKVSDSDRDEIHLAKQILKGALKQGREIASEVKEIKREFDELQAAKILESRLGQEKVLYLSGSRA